MKQFNFRVTQHADLPGRRQIDVVTDWIIVFSNRPNDKTIKRFPYASIISDRRRKMKIKGPDKEPFNMDLPNAIGSRIAQVCINSDMDSYALLTLARKLVASFTGRSVRKLRAVVAGFEVTAGERIAEALVAAAAAAAVEMPDFRKHKNKSVTCTHLELFGVKAGHGFRRTLAEAEGNYIARYLSMLPPNKLTPKLYRGEIGELSRHYGWKQEFIDEAALRRKKAGAFLAVTQGSPARDAGIMRLEYRPPGKSNKKHITLAGKGICFDTGGTNLKPANFMYGMHEDMQGSAVALGTLIALTRLKVDFPVECWLALAMNHIGPDAYKPNDVVVACDGTSIEIVHTDAEGRMVLADTLALASGRKPALLIDYATLTGACVYSLGTAYSGVFSNRSEFNPILVDAGRDSGERVWPFPMDEDYDSAIESRVADIKQCATEGGRDHILAARFLQRFIKENVPWVHVDLSAGSHKGGLAHIPTDTTGFGIRFTLNLLLDKKPV